MLGATYTLGNFGVVAATLMLNTNKPYFYEPAFQSAMTFQPNIVIIMLGTNDAQTNNYLSIDRFNSDYEALINETLELANHPKIFLVKPPPLFTNNLSLSNLNLVEGVIPRITQVANENNLTTIDCFTPLSGHSEYFIDGVHPTQEGSTKIAEIIYNAISVSAQPISS